MNDPYVSTSVVEKVAESKNVLPTALPPLSTAIDPDALDAIYSAVTATERARKPPSVRFTYAGCDVVVHSPTDISV